MNPTTYILNSTQTPVYEVLEMPYKQISPTSPWAPPGSMGLTPPHPLSCLALSSLQVLLKLVVGELWQMANESLNQICGSGIGHKLQLQYHPWKAKEAISIQPRALQYQEKGHKFNNSALKERKKHRAGISKERSLRKPQNPQKRLTEGISLLKAVSKDCRR